MPLHQEACGGLIGGDQVSKNPHADLPRGDVFGRSQPRAFTREGRVAMVQEVIDRLDSDGGEAALYVASALAAWLGNPKAKATDLVNEYLQIGAQRGSHLTPQALARRNRRGER